MTQDFFKKSNLDVDFNQVLNVYKINLIEENYLTNSLSLLNKLDFKKNMKNGKAILELNFYDFLKKIIYL